MSLFKPFMGSRANLDAVEKHVGHAYFCTNDGSFHIDYTDADGSLQRKQITATKTSTITLPASNWVNGTNLYSQVVTVSGATTNSKIDIHPTPEQLVELQSAGIALMAVNEGGVITVYALNHKPTLNYVMQVIITDVNEGG